MPAGGFYEWRKDGATKQPFLIRRRDQAPIAFAGLWERWVNPASKEPLETFTIVTTAANELMRPIHAQVEEHGRGLDPQRHAARRGVGEVEPASLAAVALQTLHEAVLDVLLAAATLAP